MHPIPCPPLAAPARARRRSRDAVLVLLAVAGLAGSVGRSDAGPFFVRITDPTNPVVTDLFETGGGAWADLDGDGLPELFVANGNLGNQNDALYLNLGGFAFQRVVGVPMATDGGSSIGATWGDYDNDGLLDLFVTNRNFFGNFLYHATGDTSFARVHEGPIDTDLPNSNSASWVDLNGDGALDLFVVNFQGVDDMYLNSGPPDFTFTAVDTGTILGPAGDFSIPGAWCDYDDDGDLDLFVGNAGTQNDYLYTHVEGLFFTRTTFADGRSTLGASWGDFDNDGDLDLFAPSFLNQTSVLYANSGAPAWTLDPAAGTPFPANPGNAVGSAWGDFDNDGDLDLYVARDGQNNLLFVNSGPPGYTLARVDTLGVSTDGGGSFGCSWADIDGDGDLDLFVANRLNQANFLYRNDGAQGNWLKLNLRGTTSNRTAIGARVRVRAVVNGQPLWQIRDVEAQSGYNSQSLELHFGLGDATMADTVIVRWPAGTADTLLGLPANAAHALVEGAGTVSVPRPFGSPAEGRWSIVRNPLAGDLEIDFDLPRSMGVAVERFDVAGRRIASAWTGTLPAGRSRRSFVAEGGPPGVYLVRVRLGGNAVTRRYVRIP